jgi:hypothetical protein
MHKLCFFLLLFVTKISFGQIEITWKTLEDVEFTDTYLEELDAYYYYPYFGPNVSALEGQEVILRGFVLAIDPVERYYILSKGPYASCFFCGGAGPETIVELELKSDKDYFLMDELVTMKGILKLNADDIYKCNYILEKAEVYRR